MNIDVSANRTLRVVFCHSSHDKSFSPHANPGGLRDQVDCLAYSTRRRVTLCEISEVTCDVMGAPTVTPLVTGIALCHYTDQFVKLRGRAISLKRAMACGKHRGVLNVRDEDAIWDVFELEANELSLVEDEHRKQSNW